MHFRHDGSKHAVTRITGPSHNYLAITFTTENQSREPQVIELPPRGDCEHRSLDHARVLAAVFAGVAEGNREFSASFAVESLQYVANDTGPEEVYRPLARAIVEETLRHQAEQET
jgi:hypothetical protein